MYYNKKTNKRVRKESVMIDKNNVLIITSEEGVKYGEIIQEELSNIGYISLDKQLIGKPMGNKLNRLIKGLEECDFGIIVITEMDIELYNKDIIFLVGLLIGNLSLERTAILLPNNIDISNITSYLKGFEPNYYYLDLNNENLSIISEIFNIKSTLRNLERKISLKEYDIINNKKELLRIALECYGENNDRYNPFLTYLMKYFNVDVGLTVPRVRGITLFKKSGEYLEQIGAAGIKSNHKFLLTDTDKSIVRCYIQDELLLGEKIDRYTCDEEIWEYIFMKPILKEYVLNVHLNCRTKISNNYYVSYLQALEKANAGYISILQLFLKGEVHID